MSQLPSIITSALAVTVSGYALYVSRSSARGARHEDTIKSSYVEFEQLGLLRMDHWSASHLLEIPENYAQAKHRVMQAVTPLTGATRNELLLRERAVATQIFCVFEKTYYSRQHAYRQGDRDRVEFLDDVLAFYTGRLLANPRLRWLWSAHGGNLCACFEKEIVRLYTQALPDEGRLLLEDAANQMDPAGPYLSCAS